MILDREALDELFGFLGTVWVSWEWRLTFGIDISRKWISVGSRLIRWIWVFLRLQILRLGTVSVIWKSVDEDPLMAELGKYEVFVWGSADRGEGEGWGYDHKTSLLGGTREDMGFRFWEEIDQYGKRTFGPHGSDTPGFVKETGDTLLAMAPGYLGVVNGSNKAKATLLPKLKDMNALLVMFPRIWKVDDRVAGADLSMGRFQFDFDEEEDIISVMQMESYRFDGWMVEVNEEQLGSIHREKESNDMRAQSGELDFNQGEIGMDDLGDMVDKVAMEDVPEGERNDTVTSDHNDPSEADLLELGDDLGDEDEMETLCMDETGAEEQGIMGKDDSGHTMDRGQFEEAMIEGGDSDETLEHKEDKTAAKPVSKVGAEKK
ncbi:unnamed protein product [Thlaspi arvense]|uniref:DUF4283 domain-containing protein n=1 Tax=Thlaspi arvense TaxID=13288 RepID=A0AAU9SPW6_THLAR|nr:unnamed protein product [Thlaspi arvense]